MEEKYTQEKLVNLFKKIRIDNFLIECLEHTKSLIQTGGLNIPEGNSEHVVSTIDVLKTLGKQLDSFLHELLPDILSAEGVVKRN
jgi:hypothetical protein